MLKNGLSEHEPPGPPDAELPVAAEINVSGHFDGVFGRAAGGWVIDGGLAPGQFATVDIVFEGEVVASGLASHFRPDLKDLGMSDGNNGFSIPLPEHLFDGIERRLEACVSVHDFVLPGSPKPLNRKAVDLREAFAGAPVTPEALAVAPVPAPQAPQSDADLNHRLVGLIEKLEQRIDHQNKLLELALGTLADKLGVSLHGVPQLMASPLPAPPPAPVKPDRGEQFDACLQGRSSLGDIILFSIIDWNFRNQRPQHLCRQFAAAGYRVLYVSVHLDPKAPSQASYYEVRSNPAPGVFEIKLRVSQEIPSVYSGFTEPVHVRELCTALEQMRKDLSIERSYSVINFPTWFPVAISIPGTVLVYDCLDHVTGFSNVSAAAAEQEGKLVAGADVVVTSSKYLEDFVLERRDEATMVRNGCEFDYFAGRPPELAFKAEAPTIGYYGAISEWFDVELIAWIAERNKDWKFVLIGDTTGADVKPLETLKNVELLGEKPYGDLTKYLYAFDVCIIPFKLVDLIKATNPVKLYEYMAAGKPVVCTAMPEARLVPQGLVHIAETKEQFEEAIFESLVEDDGKIVEARKDFAKDNSWMERGAAYTTALQSFQPRVSIVVLCYNNLIFTKACLASIEKYSHYPNIELVCVDNKSSDGTQAFLTEWAKSRPWCKVVLNDENLGFAAGNNVGIEASTGEYVILLNNDTFVTAGWVHDLIRPMMADAKIGMTGPVTNMIGNVQKIKINYADMTEMAERARAFTISRKRTTFETTVLAFFCVAIRRSVIDEVGVLDPAFGVGFFEDDDYCIRVRNAGFRAICVDGVFVHHHLSASFDALSDGRKADLFRRNKEIFETKWGAWKPHKYRDEPGFG